MSKKYLFKKNLGEISDKSKGRLFAEVESKYRSEFQRDRDRIIHSTAFRRLSRKTQVFINPLIDHYRTRLTHSLEVAQIAKALARLFHVDEDLTEAIALSHDLGHPPFGHAGERFLQEKMQSYGSFSHNYYSFMLLTHIEDKYPNFSGLNLCYGTLDGILKHNGPVLSKVNDKRDERQKALIPKMIVDVCEKLGIDFYNYTSIEGQIAAIADDIAYHSHDIDDGFRSGILKFDELIELPLIGEQIKNVKNNYKSASTKQIITLATARIIGDMVEDVLQNSEITLVNEQFSSSGDIKNYHKQVINFSQHMSQKISVLRKFLHENFYFHKSVVKDLPKVQEVIFGIFDYYMENQQKLPISWLEKQCMLGLIDKSNNYKNKSFAQTLSYYIAGMTDHYAILHWKNICNKIET